jgi:hypothetical protein
MEQGKIEKEEDSGAFDQKTFLVWVLKIKPSFGLLLTNPD